MKTNEGTILNLCDNAGAAFDALTKAKHISGSLLSYFDSGMETETDRNSILYEFKGRGIDMWILADYLQEFDEILKKIENGIDELFQEAKRVQHND